MAVIIAQALNHGNLSMAETSDIPYHVLEATYQQYLRLSTLQASNDRISNFIAGLSIFPYYSFGLETLYGSVDGQKFEMGTPTIKARYSKKYYRRGKGVVAYSLLANHIPLQSEVIGAHEHESTMSAIFNTTIPRTSCQRQSLATCTASIRPTSAFCTGLA